MPQFDIFFYFNTIFFFLISFIALYLVMSYIILPRILSSLKIRKQKMDHLYKIFILSKLRFNSINAEFFNKNFTILSALVKNAFVYFYKKK